MLFSQPTERVVMKTESLASLNPRLFDVAFTGEPLQCHEGDGTCAALRKAYRFAGSAMRQEEANLYKYVMDVDGEPISHSPSLTLMRKRLRQRVVWTLSSTSGEQVCGVKVYRYGVASSQLLPVLTCVVAFVEWYTDRIMPWLH